MMHRLQLWLMACDCVLIALRQWRQSWGVGGRDPQILKWGVVEVGRGGCGFRSFTQ
jgi:hypothetical protein